MVKIIEMDKNVTLKSQLEEDVGPVVLLNKFTVNPEDVDKFLKVFADTTKMFRKQPGFISAQLHRGIGGSSTFFNYVIWESAIYFKRLIGRSSGPAWLTFFLILLCLRIYSRRQQFQGSV
jgi:Antibiotic biosynthesis monooxygenase